LVVGTEYKKSLTTETRRKKYLNSSSSRQLLAFSVPLCLRGGQELLFHVDVAGTGFEFHAGSATAHLASEFVASHGSLNRDGLIHRDRS